jgi:hypothetical protein
MAVSSDGLPESVRLSRRARDALRMSARNLHAFGCLIVQFGPEDTASTVPISLSYFLKVSVGKKRHKFHNFTLKARLPHIN